MARFFRDRDRFSQQKQEYPRFGTEKEKIGSRLADSLRCKTLSVIRLDGNSIESSNNYDEIVIQARKYVGSQHGSVFVIVFMLRGDFYACIESEESNSSSTHVEIDTTHDLVLICDAIYDGEGKTLNF